MTSQVKIVGRYELLDPIGHGGMAVVYLARQTDLDRQVALKELRLFQSPDDPALAERFLREARMAGSMSHPNIVTVHEYFKHEGTPYIAMEYLQRGSLRPWVGSLSLAQIAGVLEGLLAALDHAEGFRVVHRDLKPENLLVTDQGQIKVADFGIAKARTMNTSALLTKDGTTVGTPTYMAPEQAMAQDLGPYTDLYSVGVMAYELLAGQVPFHDTTTPVAIILRHVNEDIPPAHTVNPAINRALSDWIDRLLIKEPERRMQTAEQAWDELEEIVLGLLGSRWRREARLLGSSEQPAARPLTPAPFTSTAGETPVPDVPAAETPADVSVAGSLSSEFESFAWGPAALASPAADPAVAPVGPEARPGSAGASTQPEAAPAPESGAAAPAAPAQPATPAEPVRPAEPGAAGPSRFETYDPRGPQPGQRAVPPPAGPQPPPAPFAPPPRSPPTPTPTPTPPQTAPAPPTPASRPVWATASDPALDAVHAPTVMPDSVPEPSPGRSGPSRDVVRRRRAALIGAVAGVLVIAVVGFVVAGGGGSSDDPTGPTSALRNDDLTLNVPTSWRKRAAPDIPGLHARNAVAAAAPGGASVVVAEHLAGRADPTLLPQRLRAALRRGPGTPETFAAAGTQGYRYDALRARGVQGPLRVYALLTSAGVATVVCGSSATAGSAVAAECDKIARTLSLTSAEARPVGLSEDYSRLLAKTVATLNSGVHTVNTSLADAGTPSARARAMRRASGLYRTAAASLGEAGTGLNPLDLGVNPKLVAAFQQFASAYARVARATRSNTLPALRRARGAVTRTRPKLASATAALRRLGYTAALPAMPDTPQSPVASRRRSNKAAPPPSSPPAQGQGPAGPPATKPPAAKPPAAKPPAAKPPAAKPPPPRGGSGTAG